MPLITSADQAAARDACRRFAPSVDRYERDRLALLFGVSRSTVNGWFVQTANQGNLLPRRTVGRSSDNLTGPDMGRMLLAACLTNWRIHEPLVPGQTLHYKETSFSLTQCLYDIYDLHCMRTDPYLFFQWVSMQVSYDADNVLWDEVITYEEGSTGLPIIETLDEFLNSVGLPPGCPTWNPRRIINFAHPRFRPPGTFALGEP